MRSKKKLRKTKTAVRFPLPQPRKRGRRVSLDPRKPSHIPLNTEEREKLYGVAESMGLPYATWARMTLLVVAEWPLVSQPIVFQAVKLTRTSDAVVVSNVSDNEGGS